MSSRNSSASPHNPHLRDKLSLHERSKRTGLSRNTLRKWLRPPETEVVSPPRYRRGEVP